MSHVFHIPRRLQSGDKTIAECELLVKPGVVIVLAEPGAGKTALLANLGRRLETSAVKASCYFEAGTAPSQVIDALDEVARLGPHDFAPLLSRIRASGADRIVLSSRSGEWEQAQTQLVKSMFEVEPVVVRLLPLTEQEQRLLFANELPHENFDDFAIQVHKFDLGQLLGNPEFLKLFAAAYIESGRVFKSRRAVFDDAVKHLAHEANKAISQKGSPTRNQRVAWAEEVFAKLLLSGSVGVSVVDNLDDTVFPSIGDIVVQDSQVTSILDTKLFKPASGAGLHEPIHRIVAEYCAARYLVRLVDDPTNPLSIRQCLSLIAPNGVARDELRGLLGWMAALGSQAVQEAAIDSDPYAVLGNGDPSMLSESAKLRLLAGLKELQSLDPHFRRSDRWREFSASGFFTPNVIQAAKPILLAHGGDDELRMLLLELLEGSPANEALAPELKRLVLDEDSPEPVRVRSQMQLATVKTHDHRSDFDTLVQYGSNTALRLASEIYVDIGITNFEPEQVLLLLKANAAPLSRDYSRIFGMQKVFRSLEIKTVVYLLDTLTGTLTCNCNAEYAHDCHCRDNVSKTVGSLLDRYFELSEIAEDPTSIWGWIKNLNFHKLKSAKDSNAVKALQENHGLRQSIQQLAMGQLTDDDKIRYIYLNQFVWYGHSGLGFQILDQQAMADLAFKTNNISLWNRFLYSHRYYNEPDKRGPDILRSHMRTQAKENLAFMAVWVSRNRTWEKQWQEGRLRRPRFVRMRARRDRRVAERTERSLREDKSRIEAGLCWGWLNFMASLYLSESDRLDEEFGGKIDVERSLRNSISGQANQIPTLDQCGHGRKYETVRIFHAACLAEYRSQGNLKEVGNDILKVAKFNIGGYEELPDDEVKRFEAELDRRLFHDFSREQYLRDLIEPQLKGNQHIDLSWLDRKPEFQEFRSTLPMKWLVRFPALPYEVMDRLFEMAAIYGDRVQLSDLIRQRCDHLLQQFGPFQKNDPRTFWFLRNFYFIDDHPPEILKWLASDPENIFLLHQNPNRRRNGDGTGWPDLKAQKIQHVLDSFIKPWPRVPLQNSWGTGSPKNETAYRYLTEVVWVIGRDSPEQALPVLNALLSDTRFKALNSVLRSIRASVLRTRAHQKFMPPKPEIIVALLDKAEVASVEQMRALVLEQLENLQVDICGGDLDVLDIFYDGDIHLMENATTKRIVLLLRHKLQALDISDAIEHQLMKAKRCDFTASKMLAGKRKLLVVEVKGQWNTELYTAASDQLFNRYAIHPDAEYQGIYLVLWFGPDDNIAGRKDRSITTAIELKEKIESSISDDLRGQIDVFVLDLSR